MLKLSYYQYHTAYPTVESTSTLNVTEHAMIVNRHVPHVSEVTLVVYVLTNCA